VSDGELWTAAFVDGGALGAPRRLSDDAAPGVTNGLADYVAAEELARDRGHWWNATGDAIAYAHVDERHIPTFHLQHLTGDRPQLEEHRYPFAGGPNAHVTLRVARTADGAADAIDLGMGDDDYLARAIPEPGGTWLVAVLPRRQTSLRWLRVAVDGSAVELWTESAEPWLNLDTDTRVLADGRILRSTEATGFRHLELRAPDGTPERVLTAGDWMVTSVAGIDETAGTILFHATVDGVLERHLYTVPLDAPRPVRAPERRTTERGWHDAVAARNGSWADRWSNLETPPSVVIHPAGGAAPRPIHAPASVPAHLVPPQLTTVLAADGTTQLHAALYRPSTARADPPPLVVWVYGGPHSQKVADTWELTAQPWRQLMTGLGTAVLVVDNRGTANRGVAFEAALARALGEVEVADQLAAVEQLAERGLVDPGRVAITGGSYGGYMVVRCMLRHPERFRCGVAWAPVVDWEGYDTAYTERYLGTPADNPSGYSSSSLRPDIGRMAGSLLVQHGMVDENVHFRHTARLLDAMATAGVTCDLQIFPGERHSGRNPVALAARDRRAIAHLASGLDLELPDGWDRDPEAEVRPPRTAG
jgi:dipeptidyl-peptidase-4